MATRESEVSRQIKRILDSASFGIYGEAVSKEGQEPSFRSARDFQQDPFGVSLDVLSSGLGFIAPGLGWVKATKAAAKVPGLSVAGKALAKEVPKLAEGATTAQKLGRIGKIGLQQAKEGALFGAAYSVPEIAGRQIFSPGQYTAQQNIQRIGENVIGGAVLDPAFYGVGAGVGKAASKLRSLRPKYEVSTGEERAIEELPLPSSEQPILPEVKTSKKAKDLNQKQKVQLKNIDKKIKEEKRKLQQIINQEKQTGNVTPSTKKSIDNFKKVSKDFNEYEVTDILPDGTTQRINLVGKKLNASKKIDTFIVAKKVNGQTYYDVYEESSGGSLIKNAKSIDEAVESVNKVLEFDGYKNVKKEVSNFIKSYGKSTKTKLDLVKGKLQKVIKEEVEVKEKKTISPKTETEARKEIYTRIKENSEKRVNELEKENVQLTKDIEKIKNKLSDEKISSDDKFDLEKELTKKERDLISNVSSIQKRKLEVKSLDKYIKDLEEQLSKPVDEVVVKQEEAFYTRPYKKYGRKDITTYKQLRGKKVELTKTIKIPKRDSDNKIIKVDGKVQHDKTKINFTFYIAKLEEGKFGIFESKTGEPLFKKEVNQAFFKSENKKIEAEIKELKAKISDENIKTEEKTKLEEELKTKEQQLSAGVFIKSWDKITTTFPSFEAALKKLKRMSTTRLFNRYNKILKEFEVLKRPTPEKLKTEIGEVAEAKEVNERIQSNRNILNKYQEQFAQNIIIEKNLKEFVTKEQLTELKRLANSFVSHIRRGRFDYVEKIFKEELDLVNKEQPNNFYPYLELFNKVLKRNDIETLQDISNVLRELNPELYAKIKKERRKKAKPVLDENGEVVSGVSFVPVITPKMIKDAMSGLEKEVVSIKMADKVINVDYVPIKPDKFDKKLIIKTANELKVKKEKLEKGLEALSKERDKVLTYLIDEPLPDIQIKPKEKFKTTVKLKTDDIGSIYKSMSDELVSLNKAKTAVSDEKKLKEIEKQIKKLQNDLSIYRNNYVKKLIDDYKSKKSEENSEKVLEEYKNLKNEVRRLSSKKPEGEIDWSSVNEVDNLAKNLIRPLDSEYIVNKMFLKTPEFKVNNDGTTSFNIQNFERENLDLLTDIAFDKYSGWSKKSGKNLTQLNFATIDRVLEHLFDEKGLIDAPQNLFSRLVLDSFNLNKDGMVKFSKHYTDILKKYSDLGIKERSELSAAVQMFGEKVKVDYKGREVEFTPAILKEWYPNDYKNIMNMAAELKTAYRQLLEHQNLARSFTGRPPIQERKDYFRHIYEINTNSVFKNVINNMETSISGKITPRIFRSSRTEAKLNPNAFRRMSNNPEYDAALGFREYVQNASYDMFINPYVRSFYSVADKLRSKNNPELKNYITIFDNFGRMLAGERLDTDVAIQNTIGQTGMQIVEATTGRIKKNNLLASITAALAQLTNLGNVTAILGSGNTRRGFTRTIKEIMLSSGGKEVANSPSSKSAFLNERFNGQDYYRRLDTRLTEKASRIMGKITLETTDYLASKIAWNSAYEQALKEGVSNPILRADNITRRLLAGRGIGEKSLMFSQQVPEWFLPYQLEVANLLSLNARAFKYNKPTFFRMLIASYLVNSITYNLISKTYLFDPVGATIEGVNAAEDEVYQSKKFEKLIGRLVGDVVSNVPGGAYIGEVLNEQQRKSFFGENDPSRYGSGMLIRDIASDPFNSLMYQYGLPFGGTQLKRVIKGAMATAEGGVYKEHKTDPESIIKFITNYARKDKTGKELQFLLSDGNLFERAKPFLGGIWTTKNGQEYIQENRKPFSEKQTQSILNSPDPEKAYVNAMYVREITRLKNLIKKISSDETLPRPVKTLYVEQIRKRIIELSELR